MDSKILDEDKDEWIFSSLKRYTNLYMFELEFPVNALEVIGETSICLSGTQAFSKKCEILQLSIPPKLFPKDMEEGLCKDRDFQIISGGYASSKILQIKPIRASDSLVACTELGANGITLFKLGNDDCAVIQELTKLNVATTTPHLKSETSSGVIDTHGSRIVLGDSSGGFLYEWNLDMGCPSSLNSSTCMKYPISWSWSPFGVGFGDDDLGGGGITKLKFWDENTITFCTSKGVVALYDLRCGHNHKSQNFLRVMSTKSPLFPKPAVVADETDEILDAATATPPVASSSSSSSQKIDTQDEVTPSAPTETLFSFDTVPQSHKICIIDSQGGYESYDSRMIKTDSSGSGGMIMISGRKLMSGFSSKAGIVRDRFNIELKPESVSRSVGVGNGTSEFIVTGLREEFVHVNAEKSDQVDEISPIFVHDGHSKNVSHALWHPHLDRLVFSASVDSMLHAWQYNENYKE